MNLILLKSKLTLIATRITQSLTTIIRLQKSLDLSWIKWSSKRSWIKQSRTVYASMRIKFVIKNGLCFATLVIASVLTKCTNAPSARSFIVGSA